MHDEEMDTRAAAAPSEGRPGSDRGHVRCTRCCMPASVPNISFNRDGVCDYCRNFKEQACLGEDALREVLDLAKRARRRYDCIVPLSGGRDSSFVLYTAKVVLGLNVLAVNYDNEFRVNPALVNMKNACRILGVELLSVRSKRGIARRIVLSSLRASLSEGLSTTAGDVCRACCYGYRSVAYRAAHEHGVPLILWGQASVEATQDMEKQAVGEPSRGRMRKLLNPNFLRAEYYAFRQRMEFQVPGNSVWCRRGIPVLKMAGAQEIRFFDYLKWDRKRIKDTITKELGWRAPEGSITTWRIDCSLHHLVNYCYLRSLGCSKDCFGYTKMINSGQMTREEGLEQELRTAAAIGEQVQEVLTDIGLDETEVAEVLSSSPTARGGFGRSMPT